MHGDPFIQIPQACYKMVVQIFADYNLLIYAIFYCEMGCIQLLFNLCNTFMRIQFYSEEKLLKIWESVFVPVCGKGNKNCGTVFCGILLSLQTATRKLIKQCGNDPLSSTLRFPESCPPPATRLAFVHFSNI